MLTHTVTSQLFVTNNCLEKAVGMSERRISESIVFEKSPAGRRSEGVCVRERGRGGKGGRERRERKREREKDELALGEEGANTEACGPLSALVHRSRTRSPSCDPKRRERGVRSTETSAAKE